MITDSQLIRHAAGIIKLDADGTCINGAETVAAVMADYGVSKARAKAAVGTAARRARTQRFADDDEAATFTLRVRLTERQREHLQILADQETGGDMSKLVRRRVFA